MFVHEPSVDPHLHDPATRKFPSGVGRPVTGSLVSQENAETSWQNRVYSSSFLLRRTGGQHDNLDGESPLLSRTHSPGTRHDSYQRRLAITWAKSWAWNSITVM